MESKRLAPSPKLPHTACLFQKQVAYAATIDTDTQATVCVLVLVDDFNAQLMFVEMLQIDRYYVDSIDSYTITSEISCAH